MRRGALTLLAVGLLSTTADAGLITFESTPAGLTPTDNAALTAAYAITGGTVRFYFEGTGGTVNPVFEARNNRDADPQGFASFRNGGQDRPAGGNLGNWFLRQPDGIGVLPGPFIIDYDMTQAIDALSGEIWDIDSGTGGTEQWRIEVLDSTGMVVDTQLSPIGLDPADLASLDSLPWMFSFTGLAGLSTDVDKVRLTFIGTKTDGIGLSFNNYSVFDVAANAVPEPSSILLLGAGAIGLLGRGWRRHRATRA